MKNLLLTLLSITYLQSFSQPYVAGGYQSGGMNLMAGYLVTGEEEPARLENLEISLQYRRPFNDQEDPKTLGLGIGYEIGSLVSLTPSIVYNATFYTDYTKYEALEAGVGKDTSGWAFSYGLELGRNFHDGNAIPGRYSYKAVLLNKRVYHGVYLRLYF